MDTDTETDTDDILGQISRLMRAERSALAALARAEGMTPEDAVDCVQEGFCTLLDLARRGALPEDPGAWGGLLGGVVRNVARNRRRRHFLARPHEALSEDAQVEQDAPSADDVIARAEEHIRLRACVAELCEIQRAVVTLRMLEEQPGEDVGRALGISAGHVAVLLHRARKELHACMTGPP